jgi:hypothetical protein
VRYPNTSNTAVAAPVDPVVLVIWKAAPDANSVHSAADAGVMTAYFVVVAAVIAERFTPDTKPVNAKLVPPASVAEMSRMTTVVTRATLPTGTVNSVSTPDAACKLTTVNEPSSVIAFSLSAGVLPPSLGEFASPRAG